MASAGFEQDPDPDRRQQALRRALARLDGPDAELLRLRHEAGLGFDVIAERTQLTSASVRTRYYRALMRLRRLLDGPSP